MDLMLTITVSMAVALVLGYLTQRLGLSPIVGYLVAGAPPAPTSCSRGRARWPWP
jgi:CPA2 family monovalent cation:H+ antiporter-2